MNFLQFLNTLENTLENISIRGRDDLERVGGICAAIDQMRHSILNPHKKEGGEEDGRQSDIGTDSGNDSKRE